MKPCKYCNGQGGYYAEKQIKVTKPGYGKVLTDVIEQWKPCPRCHGTGKKG